MCTSVYLIISIVRHFVCWFTCLYVYSLGTLRSLCAFILNRIRFQDVRVSFQPFFQIFEYSASLQCRHLFIWAPSLLAGYSVPPFIFSVPFFANGDFPQALARTAGGLPVSSSGALEDSVSLSLPGRRRCYTYFPRPLPAAADSLALALGLC